MKKILCIILALSFCAVSFAATVDNEKSQFLSSVMYQYTSTDNKKGQSQEDYSFTVTANQEQLKKINELKGKKMTRLEFFEAVFPDIVSKLSDNQKKLYASIPFEAPTPQTPAPGTGSSGRN
jgi:hypothetical protein